MKGRQAGSKKKSFISSIHTTPPPGPPKKLIQKSMPKTRIQLFPLPLALIRMFSPIFKKQISGKHPIQALDVFFWRVIKTRLVDDLLQSFRVVDHEIVGWRLVGVAPFLDERVVFAGVRGCETGAGEGVG